MGTGLFEIVHCCPQLRLASRKKQKNTCTNTVLYGYKIANNFMEIK